MVADVQNLTTWFISTQYYAVFDYLFQAVYGTEEDEVVNDYIYKKLLNTIDIVRFSKSMEKRVN